MYKARHSYESGNDGNHTLSFKCDENLYVLEQTNSNWWLASNENGEVGYIPKSYVEKQKELKSDDAVLMSIERAISAVISRSNQGQLTNDEMSVLKTLKQHKEKISSKDKRDKKESGKRRAPPPPPRLKMDEASFSPAVDRGPVVSCVETNECPASISLIHVPEDLGKSLVGLTQQHANVPFAKARHLVKDCLTLIGQSIPSIDDVAQKILATLPDETSGDTDMELLGLAFANLAEIKDDAQQRNWAIENDELDISKILNDIMHILTEGNKQKCIAEVSRYQFLPISTLATYYQMETRTSIRIILLQIFGILCSMSPKFISVLLSTVLPNELVREVYDHSNDVERTCYVALILSMLFSTGEPVPVSYYEIMGERFLSFILNCIETRRDNDNLIDVFVRLVLSINLHFSVPSDNLVMQAVKKELCTGLSEKIMLLCNRGDDPTKVTEVDDWTNFASPPNSVIKFLQDIFSCRETASFLYTNDLLVLIDIIVRNIGDLPAGAKVRTEYLDLLLCVVKNSTFLECNHRLSEIVSLLHRIKKEESEEDRIIIDFDKKIACSILSELESCS